MAHRAIAECGELLAARDGRGRNTEASGRAIGAIARHGNTAVATPIAAAINAAALANTPRPFGEGIQ